VVSVDITTQPKQGRWAAATNSIYSQFNFIALTTESVVNAINLIWSRNAKLD